MKRKWLDTATGKTAFTRRMSSVSQAMLEAPETRVSWPRFFLSPLQESGCWHQATSGFLLSDLCGLSHLVCGTWLQHSSKVRGCSPPLYPLVSRCILGKSWRYYKAQEWPEWYGDFKWHPGLDCRALQGGESLHLTVSSADLQESKNKQSEVISMSTPTSVLNA